MTRIIALIDELDAAIEKVDGLMCLDGHTFCLLGLLYNAPLIVAFGSLRILMCSESGELVINKVAKLFYRIIFKEKSY